MRRTEVLQGLRRMKFEDIYGGWQQRRLSQAEAAEILGMSERSLRRWRDRYEDQGVAGLLDRRLGKASARRAAVDQVQEVLSLVSRALRRLHRQALPRQAAPVPRRHAWLYLDRTPAAGGWPGPEGRAPLGPSQEAAAAALARHAGCIRTARAIAGCRPSSDSSTDPRPRHYLIARTSARLTWAQMMEKLSLWDRAWPWPTPFPRDRDRRGRHPSTLRRRWVAEENRPARETCWSGARV